MTMFYPARCILRNPPLFIGSEENALDAAWMARHKIKLIVNCTRDVPAPFSQTIRTIRCPVDDHPSEAKRMASFFARVCRDIHEARQRGEAVLVHCFAGISRSATVVAAYIMYSCGKSAREAVSYIQARKPETFGGSRHPLGVFHKALLAWEGHLGLR